MTEKVQHNGWSWERTVHILLVMDPAVAEIVVGIFVVGMRGLMLMSMGYVYRAVADLLESAYLSAPVMGLAIVLVGSAQVALAVTCHYRTRAFTSFVSAVCCFVIWVGYLGADKEQTAMAWMWFGLMLSEMVLAWRVLLTRLAQLEKKTKAVYHAGGAVPA